jgi:FKBP-type peptidyl-prolyl cis-trans isomerase
LDPRVADPTHGGNRWVSPPTYFGANAQDTIEAMAQGVDRKGAAARISPNWIPSDPGMVSVSRGQGNQVKIVVKRAGESKLTVAAGAVSTDLIVQAKYVDSFIHVAITQPRPKEAAPIADPKTAKRQAERKGPTEAEARAVRQRLLEGREQKKLALQRQKEHAAKAVKNLGGGAGMVTLSSGLQYRVLKTGSGRKPLAGESVKCKIRVTQLDGTEFDSAYRTGEVVTFDVAGDTGLGEALRLMRVGSRWQVFLPGRVASREAKRRGRKRSGMSAGYSVPLVYEVELLGVKALAKAGGKTTSVKAVSQR